MQLEVEIRRVYKKEADDLTKIRKELKNHFYDLTTTIKDGELIAKSTKKNMLSTVRKLNARTRFKNRKILTPTREAKVWGMVVRKLVNDITYSMKKVSAVVKVLDKLQQDCIDTVGDIEALEKFIISDLADKMKNVQADLDKANKKQKNACTLGEVIAYYMSFTLADKKCPVETDFKTEIKKHEKQLSILKSLNSKLVYFKNVSKMAKKLTKLAIEERDSQSQFKSKLE